MSYIDTIKHELLGYLNGLPIYHPIENHTGDGWDEYDFSCTTDNLIIGGGGGEHPALIIHELGALVSNYVLHCIDEMNNNFDNYITPPESTLKKLNELAFSKESKHLEFCGWKMCHYYEFIENAKSTLHGNPLEDISEAEEWIKLSIGEFVFHSLPELNPYHEEILNLEGIKNGWKMGYWMINVTCPPPNYIKSKKQSLQDDGFKEHGFFRWDYQYPPKK